MMRQQLTPLRSTANSDPLTALARKVMFSVVSLCLFPLYRLNELTFDLDFCMYMGHEA